MKRLLLFSLSILLGIAPASAQQATQDRNTTATKKSLEQQRQTRTKERRGTIKGRVVTDGGQPLPFVGISVSPVGSLSGNRRTMGTDEEGRFEVDELTPAAYSITASVPGYIAANPTERKPYRIGETATVTMIKGGVITGMVKTAAGEPVINVPVRTLRVKDADGKPTRSQGYSRDRQSDDRGIYRLYGLEPGTYLVFAGGTSLYYSGYNKYGEDVPTYYPSATRDTAVEVIVQAGQEASAIDITYRGEKGHAISGAIAGTLPATIPSTMFFLLNASTGQLESTTQSNFQADRRSFAFYGIPDGDYYLVAEAYAYPNEKDFAASHIRRVAVKGADVTGLELPLAPMASISGRVVLEPAVGVDAKGKCENKREASVEETTLNFLRETRGEVNTPNWLRGSASSPVDENGGFAVYRLYADRYRMDVNLPNENWYVRAIEMGEAAKGRAPLARNAQANDVVTKGLALKAGEKIENLTITIAEGAAALSGKVTATSDNDKLPSRVRVYLVPSERERADEVLRYAQAEVQGDGAYTFANLAPGKYWLVTKEVPAEEGSEAAPRPLYWDGAGRVALRKEAEAANAAIELQSCQTVKDFRLRFATKKM